MKPFFVTGTDTNCGKTYVVCQLLDWLHAHHKTAIGLKPVASGCTEENGVLINEDVVCIQKSNHEELEICKWKFLPPISPHIAAAQVNQTLSIDHINQFCSQDVFKEFDYVLIEGAGGLMAPLNSTATWLDFAVETKLSVILVVGMRLGCLNHAFLTAEVLKQYHIDCIGWIANCIDPDMLALEDNIHTLKMNLDFPYLGTLPYHGSLVNVPEFTL